MQHNAHIMRTVAHFIRKANLFGVDSFTRKEKRVYKACYAALEADQQEREAQQIAIATLQMAFPWHMQITVEQRPLRWYNDGHTILRTPVLVLCWPSQDDRAINTLFTLN